MLHTCHKVKDTIKTGTGGGHTPFFYAIVYTVIKRPVLAELLQLAEATLVATTLSIGIVATGSSIISGTAPPDLSTFITSVQPPYESDDKRIYPEVLEEKEILPDEERIQN